MCKQMGSMHIIKKNPMDGDNITVFLVQKMFSILLFIFKINYKRTTLFLFCFLFYRFCDENNKNKEMLFLLFFTQYFENREQNKNKVIRNRDKTHF